jgi:hypothetical protein
MSVEEIDARIKELIERFEATQPEWRAQLTSDHDVSTSDESSRS